jgi:hypothetical protein
MEAMQPISFNATVAPALGRIDKPGRSLNRGRELPVQGVPMRVAK